MVEFPTDNRKVVSSSLTASIIYLGVAQFGRALALGARCRGFKSLHRDHLKTLTANNYHNR